MVVGKKREIRVRHQGQLTGERKYLAIRLDGTTWSIRDHTGEKIGQLSAPAADGKSWTAYHGDRSIGTFDDADEALASVAKAEYNANSEEGA